MKNTLHWLEDWFLTPCDGEWEHENQIKIYTADNPGWVIEIDLSFTSMEDLVFEMDTIENGENDWYAFRIKNKKFIGAGIPASCYFCLKNFNPLRREFLRSLVGKEIATYYFEFRLPTSDFRPPTSNPHFRNLPFNRQFTGSFRFYFFDTYTRCSFDQLKTIWSDIKYGQVRNNTPYAFYAGQRELAGW